MIWHAKKRKVNVCGWFIYRTIRWILLFLIWQSELRCQCTREALHQSDCFEYTLWNSYLNQATKNVYRYLYFPKFPIPEEIPWWKISKQQQEKSLYHLGNFNSLLPLRPPASGRPEGQILLVALFFLVVGSGSTLLPLPLFVLVSVSLEIS